LGWSERLPALLNHPSRPEPLPAAMVHAIHWIPYPGELCCDRSSSCCSRCITSHTSCSAATYPLPDVPWYFAASFLKFDHSCSWTSSPIIAVQDAFGTTSR